MQRLVALERRIGEQRLPSSFRPAAGPDRARADGGGRCSDQRGPEHRNRALARETRPRSGDLELAVVVAGPRASAHAGAEIDVGAADAVVVISTARRPLPMVIVTEACVAEAYLATLVSASEMTN